MLITNQLMPNFNTQNYIVRQNFKASSANRSRLYAEMDKIMKNIFRESKELTEDDINKQVLRIRRNAPIDAMKLYTRIQNSISKYPCFSIKKADIFLNKFILNKNNDIYYREFLTDGLMPYYDNYNNLRHEKTKVTLPRHVSQVLLHEKSINEVNDKDLSDKLCKLGASENVDVNELIIDESILSGQTFTSETVNNLLKNKKYNIAHDFIKTVAQRYDYYSASRDLYTILENNRDYSYEMVDIINILMKHRSFNPNYAMSYYKKGNYSFETGHLETLRNAPDGTLAYQIINFDKNMKKSGCKTNFWQKLISHSDFNPEKAINDVYYHPKSADEMYQILNNYY